MRESWFQLHLKILHHFFLTSSYFSTNYAVIVKKKKKNFQTARKHFFKIYMTMKNWDFMLEKKIKIKNNNNDNNERGASTMKFSKSSMARPRSKENSSS